MTERRSILIHGLGLTLRRLPAFLWTYLFNVSLALVFSIGLHHELSTLLNHSLATQRLISGFDLGTAAETILHLSEGPASSSPFTSSNISILAYLLLYFLLIPGTLVCYQTATPARISTLIQQGLLHFSRFFRITILTLVTGALLLTPLIALQDIWATHVDTRTVGRTAFLQTLAGYLILFLVASLIRLYFDLVEVYTVQLGLHLRLNGGVDRRVRRTLLPALRTLRHNLARAWLTFLFLTLLGAAALIFTARAAMHMLAKPRVWPMFLLAQSGLLLMLLTRFWQRGAETSLALQNPIFDPRPLPVLPLSSAPPISRIDPLHPRHPIWNPEAQPTSHTPSQSTDPFRTHRDIAQSPLSDNPLPPLPPDDPPLSDPIPNPEPASPSLDEPDPGVFHHEPGRPPG